MKRFFFLLISVIALTSCNKFKDIEVDFVSLSSFRLHSTSQAELSFDVIVDNPTDNTIILNGINGMIRKSDRDFAAVSLKETVSVPPMSREKRTVVVSFSLLDPMALLSIGLNIDSWDMSDFKVNGTLYLKTDSGLKHKFRFKNVTLERMLKILS